MQINTIRLHCTGGCGTNIGVDITRALSGLGGGFSNIETTYLDTSSKNIEHFPDDIKEDQYFLVKDSKYGAEEIDGSSSERRTNYEAISKFIANYLDSNNISKKENGVYHVVVSSAAGGELLVLN